MTLAFTILAVVLFAVFVHYTFFDAYEVREEDESFMSNEG